MGPFLETLLSLLLPGTILGSKDKTVTKTIGSLRVACILVKETDNKWIDKSNNNRL